MNKGRFSLDQLAAVVLDHEPTKLMYAQQVAKVVHSIPREFEVRPQAVIIGGFIRDAMLGLPSFDIDMSVYGVAPQKLLDNLAHRINGMVECWGTIFQVIRITFADNFVLDISIPRQSPASSLGAVLEGDPTVTLEEARLQSDFTINSMAACPLTGQVFDPYGGVADLSRRVLRITCLEQIHCNHLGLYRGIIASSRFALKLESKSRDQLWEIADTISFADHMPKSLWPIFEKTLAKSARPGLGFEFLKEVGLRYRHFPFLLDLAPEERERRWYNALEALDNAALIRDEVSDLTGFDQQAFMWTSFLLPLVGVSQSIAHRPPREQNQHFLQIVRAVAKRVNLNSYLVNLVARSLAAMTTIMSCTSDRELSKTSVFRVSNIEPRISQIHRQRSTHSLKEGSAQSQSVPITLVLENKTLQKIRQLKPLPKTLMWALLRVQRLEHFWDEAFFERLEGKSS